MGFYFLRNSHLTHENSTSDDILHQAWNVGLTLGFVFARAAKMILISCVYIGRIDTNTLARHINFFGLTIDEDDEAFHVDLLLHEAHRHPYIERLAMLYLVKFHQGSKFASRDGSRWRLLVVLALMPWLQRYRTIQRPKELE